MDINILCKAAQEGDRKAEKQLFDHLFVSFQLFVQRRIWSKDDAEELVQAALLTISEKYRNISIEVSFAAWAYKVLNNKMLDYFKKKRIRKSYFDEGVETNEEHPDMEIDPVLKSELLRCLEKICKANPRHARLLNLHYQGFKTEEICSKMKVTSGNLYVMLSRARSMLELCLNKGEIQ